MAINLEPLRRAVLLLNQEMGWSHVRIAEATGISQPTVGRIINGSLKITFETWLDMWTRLPNHIPSPWKEAWKDEPAMEIMSMASMFQDKPRALRILKNLVEIERVSQDRFELLERLTQTRSGNRHPS